MVLMNFLLCSLKYYISKIQDGFEASTLKTDFNAIVYTVRKTNAGFIIILSSQTTWGFTDKTSARATFELICDI